MSFSTVEAQHRGDVAKAIVGLSLSEAKREAARHEFVVRESIRDGEHLPRTMDYRPERINVATRGGVVDYVTGFG